MHIPGARDIRESLFRHPRRTYSYRPLEAIRKVAVHHSLTRTGRTGSIARYHVQTHGWPGIGYHFVIEKDGDLMWCNDLRVKSYHLGQSNYHAVGICLLGDFQEEDLGEKQASVWQEARFGWNYLRGLPGLFGLLLYFASVNFFLSFSNVLGGPLVLSYGTATDLGVVQMVAGVSMFVGSLVMSAWGGPKSGKVPALIAFIAFSSTGFLISGLRPNTLLISLGRVVLLVLIPFAGALSQAVFQVKIPPDIQGRVFAIRGMIARSMVPLAFVLSGPLADHFFEPLMAPGGALSDTFIGTLLGTGPGRGIGLMMILSCLFLWAESLIAYLNPRIRNLESEIPDAIPDDQEAEAVLAHSPAPSN